MAKTASHHQRQQATDHPVPDDDRWTRGWPDRAAGRSSAADLEPTGTADHPNHPGRPVQLADGKLTVRIIPKQDGELVCSRC